MTAKELKICYPKLYSQIFALGVAAERRRLAAAELIAGSVESRDRAPRGFARVAVKVAGRGGPNYVLPTY
jgi:hypothetical protein